MGDLVLKKATTGQITLTPQDVAGNQTITFPAASGTVVLAGGTTPAGNITLTTPSTTTASYINWTNGTGTVASIGGYSDSTTTGHLEFYTLASGTTPTEWARIPATGGFQINSSGGGSVLLTPASTASAYTLTMPARTGTIITSADSGTVTQAMLASNVAGNGPAFSAYANGSQTVSSDTLTKVALQLEDFDTANCFDSTTNYRFTPNVAGYYQFGCTLFVKGSGTSTTQALISIYKNGTQYARIVDFNPSATINSNGFISLNGTALMYMNGTTDYAELYGYYYLGTCTFSQSGNSTTNSRFTGALVRAA